MPSFTVIRASHKKDVDGKHGPMQVITLALKDNSTAQEFDAEWFTKASTEIPAAGSSIEGELEDGPYGKKFKKAFQGGAGGGRGRSPAETARIERMAAHKTAAAILGPLPTDPEGGAAERYQRAFKEWTDWLVADLPKAGNAIADGSPRGSSAPERRQDKSEVAGAIPAPGSAQPERKGFVSKPQEDHFRRLLKSAGGSDATVGFVTWYASENLSPSLISEALDGLADEATRQATAKSLAVDANAWSIETGNTQPDTADLPEVAA